MFEIAQKDGIISTGEVGNRQNQYCKNLSKINLCCVLLLPGFITGINLSFNPMLISFPLMDYMHWYLEWKTRQFIIRINCHTVENRKRYHNFILQRNTKIFIFQVIPCHQPFQ